MPETAKRDYYFDNLKFVLILLVVIGHALEPLYETSLSAKTLYLFIYFFHIPLFVFVTGFFTKTLDKIGHLFALYIVFEVLYTLMDFYLHDRSDLSIRFSLPYWVTWYLMAVILWKIILPYFIRLRHPIIISSVLAVLAGYAHKDLGYYLSSLRAFSFFPFFIAGYYMKREYLDFLFKKPVKITSVLIIMITVTLLLSSRALSSRPQRSGSSMVSSFGRHRHPIAVHEVGRQIFALAFPSANTVIIEKERGKISSYSSIKALYNLR